jgi:hypothetical protein
MEAVSFSETLINMCQTTQHDVTENITLHFICTQYSIKHEYKDILGGSSFPDEKPRICAVRDFQ